MVHSRLDYANSVVHGRTNIKRLQLVQNSVARAVTCRPNVMNEDVRPTGYKLQRPRL